MDFESMGDVEGHHKLFAKQRGFGIRKHTRSNKKVSKEEFKMR
jgi:hypothetical protein